MDDLDEHHETFEDSYEDYYSDHFRKRRQSGLPSYCAKKPKILDPSPVAGQTLIVTGSITIKLKARSPNGQITRFQYNSPIGMKCNKVTVQKSKKSSFLVFCCFFEGIFPGKIVK